MRSRIGLYHQMIIVAMVSDRGDLIFVTSTCGKPLQPAHALSVAPIADPRPTFPTTAPFEVTVGTNSLTLSTGG